MKKLTDSMSLLINLNLAAVKVNKKLDRSLSVHGVSFSEYMALHVLSNQPMHTMSRIALAEALGMTASGVTRMLNPLEKIHLIEKQKNPRDARISLVKLSATGAALYEDASVSFKHFSENSVSDLRQYQMESVLEVLKKF
ncbi:MarR family winged helix-turn-helix transcriptional regulator [Aliiglaciecola lipolytica]|uniref:MarR family winged helix-turn-helix transcriptional regulator n=1 Tax=Aliiglaciecola lipolytica TaxID=477689 RepID=UPI001C096BCC|nr:MarR family transcriptional regulator [Aliiglaciecola lipolytica]MBU2878628.1 MarR family transcriptional regulator [Aliiglaciecola lipolytica]